MLRQGVGWRCGWEAAPAGWRGLIGAESWAFELSEGELQDLARGLPGLVATMAAMADELADGEELTCEALGDRLQLSATGFQMPIGCMSGWGAIARRRDFGRGRQWRNCWRRWPRVGKFGAATCRIVGEDVRPSPVKSTLDLPPWFWLPLGLLGGTCFALAFYGTAQWLDRPEPEEAQIRRAEPPTAPATTAPTTTVPPAAFAPQPEMPDGTEQALTALARQGAQVGQEVVYGEPARRWAALLAQPRPVPKVAAPPVKPLPVASPIAPKPAPSLPTAAAVLMDSLIFGPLDAEGPPDRAQEARFVLTESLGTVAAGSRVYAVPRLVDGPDGALPVHFYAVRLEIGDETLPVPFGSLVLMEAGDRPVWVPAVPVVEPQGANPIEREAEPQFQLAAGRNLVLKTLVPWNP
ncbi:MAG: DUF1818 family protein [Oscillatoriales cyanobacterium SM2_1_8]|nr:DUF1818 family protein [Oscillatoriales cyanobacterium SM2_1_8]